MTKNINLTRTEIKVYSFFRKFLRLSFDLTLTIAAATFYVKSGYPLAALFMFLIFVFNQALPSTVTVKE